MSFLIRYDDRASSFNGVGQKLFQENQIKISYSSIATTTSSEYVMKDAIFYDNKTIFCTKTNCSNEANWYTLELKNHIAFIEGYRMQSHYEKDVYYLRSWRLDASLDGNNWKELHSQNNTDIFNDGNFTSFKIEQGPFRFFKITQTGDAKGTSEDQRCRLRIQRLDFFGTAIKFNPLTKYQSNFHIHFNVLFLIIFF